MKVVKIKNYVTVIFDEGTMITNSNCTEDLYYQILACNEDEQKIKNLLLPGYLKKEKEYLEKSEILEDLKNSNYLTVLNNSVYIRSISELSVPEGLALSLYKAEKEGNKELVQTYLNFWTLCSLNPDSRARANLFWFLDRYGMTISKSGFFVAYRNVDFKYTKRNLTTKWVNFIEEKYEEVIGRNEKPLTYFVGRDDYNKKTITETIGVLNKIKGNLQDLKDKIVRDTLDTKVYTDNYSKKFTINLGEVVAMDRSKCDANQDNTCSSGLHVGGKSWLKSNYFGDTTLRVLINPTDVVAVPREDSYGKMRVCAYYPMEEVLRDGEGNIVDNNITDGFEDIFMKNLTYLGKVNNTDESNHTFSIPNIPEINRENIIKRLDEITTLLNIKHTD